MNRFLLALFTAVTLVPAAWAQDPPSARGDDTPRAIIQGIVRDSLGLAVDGASVMLNPGTLITRTDSAGRFSVARAPIGNVAVAIRRLGFAPVDTQVTAHAGAVVHVEFRMRRIPQALEEVVVRGDRVRQCPRYSLEGVLCRREVGRGQFMNRDDILETDAIYPWHVLRDMPGFRQSLTDLRGVESTVGWRCISAIVDGRPISEMNPMPLVKEMFAVETYQPEEAPPEYQTWVWRGFAPCTLVVFWTDRAVQRAMEIASGRPSGLTIDLTAGGFAMSGADYTEDVGVAFSGFLGHRAPADPGRSDILGISVALFGDPGSESECDLASVGVCPAEVPFLLGLGIERGWRSETGVRGLRLGAGAYMNLKSEGGAAVGVQGQVDVAASAVLLALRGIFLPNLHGRSVVLLMLTTGVRWN